MIEGNVLEDEFLVREPTEYEKAKHYETIVMQLQELRNSEAYSEIDSRMGSEYQRCFMEAINSTDPMVSKFALERMKGVAFARAIIDSFQSELESEINYLLTEDK